MVSLHRFLEVGLCISISPKEISMRVLGRIKEREIERVETEHKVAKIPLVYFDKSIFSSGVLVFLVFSSGMLAIVSNMSSVA
jgi:hypothetical protein